MIPNSILEPLFWLAIAAMIIVPIAGSYLLHRFVFSRDRVCLETVPAEVYRIVELREFVDALWFKIYGHAIDDFALVRIDRALGRATVGEYRIQVMREIELARDTGRATLRDPDMFLTLARAAAIHAECCKAGISKSGDLDPSSNVFELQKMAGR